ncbi:hypothetical protein TESG_03663 [Trichophyton tonsurans CBS 112818]|uniref:Uncharacterized protein n=1 Tax=Trichophyton tonsurans (strain CBS 112818) TaxID=647933 RepID=F2RY54_TRIT1|nr:hypothetical protein TESG_03663 [Trichophyton tonsurans CBS 112818]
MAGPQPGFVAPSVLCVSVWRSLGASCLPKSVTVLGGEVRPEQRRGSRAKTGCCALERDEIVIVRVKGKDEEEEEEEELSLSRRYGVYGTIYNNYSTSYRECSLVSAPIAVSQVPASRCNRAPDPIDDIFIFMPAPWKEDDDTGSLSLSIRQP